MSEPPEEPVDWTDTTLRDLAAAPWGGAIATDEVAAVAAALADTGAAVLEALDPESAHEALEVRGESPWDRLRAVVREAGRVPVGIAVSGRALLGDRPLAPDLVRRFVLCAAESGAARIRAFDAMNDPEGLAPVAVAAEEAGIAFVPTLMAGPVPGPADERWREEARALAALPGVRAVCVADKAGHLAPTALADLVTLVARSTGLPVEVSVRTPGGLAPVSATAAVVAGASAVQAAAGAVALLTSRPSAETLRAALAGWRRTLGCEPAALDAAARLVGSIIPADRLRQAAIAAYGPAVPIPPELAAGVVVRLARMGMRRGLADVAAETIEVARDAGGVTLAHPLGDAVVAQAAAHVVEGVRWSRAEPALADAILGRVGRPRGPVAPQAEAAAQGASPEPPGPPMDLAAAAEQAPDGLSEEDLALWAQFPEGTRRLAARRRSLGGEVDGATEGLLIDRGLLETLVDVVDAAGGEAEVSVEVAGARVTVRRAGAAPEPQDQVVADADVEDGLVRVESPIVGTFYRAPSPEADPFVEEGERVSAGQTLCLIEAMKLFNEIAAERDGVVRQVVVENAEPVEYGQLLFLMEPT
jgi:oxaloacetate decarboxylase alpha subunit